MKNLILICLALMLSGLAFSQQDDKQLCRVNRIQGKEVYVMCEPIRDYEVIENVNTTLAQLLGVTPTLSNMIKTMVDKAVNKEKKGRVNPFDAIITSDGNTAILVKFKDGNQDQKGIGRITKMQGKEVYIMCEPLRDYETVDKVNSAFAQALGVDPNVENMVKTIVDKAVKKELKGKVGEFDAIITSDGDSAILIQLKK